MQISKTYGPANRTDKQETAAKNYLLCNKIILTLKHSNINKFGTKNSH